MEYLGQIEKLGLSYISPVQKILADNGVNLSGRVLLLAVASFFIFILFFVFRGAFRRKQRGNTILLVGVCNSGKTSIFMKLVHNKDVQTVTSMKVNSIETNLNGQINKKINLVDFPGHDRLREQIHNYLPGTGGVVFVIDAANPQIRQSAQLLYDLLVDPIVNTNRIPIHVASNKNDIQLAKTVEKLRTELESEIEMLRKTRQSAPGSTHVDNTEQIFIGIEGVPFKMEHLPFPVTFSETSVREESLDSLKEFMRNVVA
jgi:signal recognition particle receptor subunit beta